MYVTPGEQKPYKMPPDLWVETQAAHVNEKVLKWQWDAPQKELEGVHDTKRAPS